MLVDVRKAQSWEAPKKDIMNARNFKILVSENDISYFEIDGSFHEQFSYDHGIPSIINVW